jgi:hypothetical protein
MFCKSGHAKNSCCMIDWSMPKQLVIAPPNYDISVRWIVTAPPGIHKSIQAVKYHACIDTWRLWWLLNEMKCLLLQPFKFYETLEANKPYITMAPPTCAWSLLPLLLGHQLVLPLRDIIPFFKIILPKVV